MSKPPDGEEEEKNEAFDIQKGLTFWNTPHLPGSEGSVNCVRAPRRIAGGLSRCPILLLKDETWIGNPFSLPFLRVITVICYLASQTKPISFEAAFAQVMNGSEETLLNLETLMKLAE